MKDLPEAMENICRLKGEAIGMQAMINAIVQTLPMPQLAHTLRIFETETEAAKVVLLNSARANEHVLDGLDAYALQVSSRLDHLPGQPPNTPPWWRDHPGSEA